MRLEVVQVLFCKLFPSLELYYTFAINEVAWLLVSICWREMSMCEQIVLSSVQPGKLCKYMQNILVCYNMFEYFTKCPRFKNSSSWEKVLNNLFIKYISMIYNMTKYKNFLNISLISVKKFLIKAQFFLHTISFKDMAKEKNGQNQLHWSQKLLR